VDARRTRPSAPGRHFLSPRSATEFVQRLQIQSDELVVEVGAGTGRLTKELCAWARVVFASELDLILARRLLSIERPNLFVHRGDAIAAVDPGASYRVVGNAPFGIGTALLRRFLEDDRVTRVDLILQREAARKRAGGRGNVLAVYWGVRWQMTVPWEFHRKAFHPPPRVDAAWLRALPRARPLLPMARRADFERFLRRTFERGDVPIRGGLRPRDLVAAGVDPHACARDLDVEAWVRLFERVGSSG
jgi:16S rRNA A1518/A1519 N6-dimethyltransferase RsmA/KsgA/DIM1 with predicted DNA glycosylase/AP lyase activity